MPIGCLKTFRRHGVIRMSPCDPLLNGRVCSWPRRKVPLLAVLRGHGPLRATLQALPALMMPLMVHHGVVPAHYASIVTCSVVIGANSPPVAPILYMACRIGKVSIHDAIKPALQIIFCVALPVMLLVTFFPALSLFVPRLLGLH